MEGREGERRGGKGAGEGMDTPGAGPPQKFWARTATETKAAETSIGCARISAAGLLSKIILQFGAHKVEAPNEKKESKGRQGH
jgi:hypothetical protein